MSRRKHDPSKIWDQDGSFKGETKSKGRSDRLKELWDEDGNLKAEGG